VQPPGCTAEAPQKALSRRGGIPERQKRAVIGALLCLLPAGNRGNLFLREEDGFRAVAVHGDSHYADWMRTDPYMIAAAPDNSIIRLVMC
jgi:hypothetical protein